jgi:hypothetical protein
LYDINFLHSGVLFSIRWLNLIPQPECYISVKLQLPNTLILTKNHISEEITVLILVLVWRLQYDSLLEIHYKSLLFKNMSALFSKWFIPCTFNLFSFIQPTKSTYNRHNL